MIVYIVEATNFLVPNSTAATRRQWGWLVMIVLLGPFVGVLWFFLGRGRALNRLSGATT